MDKWTCSNLWRIRSENFGLNEEVLHHNSKKCGAGEDFWEFLGLQGDQSSQSQRKSSLNIHWKDWCWSWNSNTLATHWEEPIHWKRPWYWERLKAGGEGTTENEMVGWHHRLNGHKFEQAPGDGEGQRSLACLLSMGLQRVRYNWVTELYWIACKIQY